MMMTDVKRSAAEERAERQRLHAERTQQQQEAKAAAKAARQQRHAELTQAQQRDKEEKLKKKAENKLQAEQKADEFRRIRIDRQQRELSVNVDMKTLQDVVRDHYSKLGKVENVEVQFTGTSQFGLTVTFDKKEDVKKALVKPVEKFNVGFIMEGVPVPEHSVHFPYIFSEIKDRSWRPAGQPWEELKREIIRVFSSKTPSAKPLFVSYSRKCVIVTYDSTTSRDIALEATSEDKKHQWVVQGKQIPSLSIALPAGLKRKRKQPASGPSLNNNGIQSSNKVQKVG
jgi:hypothetical protein